MNKLDYLVVPNSHGKIKRQRTKRAEEELQKRNIKDIIILNGLDSEEDIIYLGKIVKRGDRVGFDTFDLHYEEYKEIIKKAIRDKIFPKGVHIENVETPEDFHLIVYGTLGLMEERLKHRKLLLRKYRKEKFLESIKWVIHKIFPL